MPLEDALRRDRRPAAFVVRSHDGLLALLLLPIVLVNALGIAAIVGAFVMDPGIDSLVFGALGILACVASLVPCAMLVTYGLVTFAFPTRLETSGEAIRVRVQVPADDTFLGVGRRTDLIVPRDQLSGVVVVERGSLYVGHPSGAAWLVDRSARDEAARELAAWLSASAPTAPSS